MTHCMNSYCHNPKAGINDTANGMAMRSDIRRCFDGHAFVFYPYHPSDYIVYIVNKSVPDYAGLLHRRLVTVPKRVSDKLLFARFAYTMINNVIHDPCWMYMDLSYIVSETTIQFERKAKQTETETAMKTSASKAPELADEPVQDNSRTRM